MSFVPSRRDANVRERVLQFGGHRTLVALASIPAMPRKVPAVLLVNAGVLHRIGPHRLHVKLARLLASAGHLAVRMDLSGIGDSSAVPDQLSFRESSVADIRSAVDQMTADNPDGSVIVFGICSGADNALAAAEADNRIVGLVLVDPPCYATSQSRMRSMATRLRDPRVRAAMPMRLLKKLRRLFSVFKNTGARTSGGRQPPPIEDYRRLLTCLVNRDVRILSIYSSVQGVRYNHAGQLYEWFPELRGKLDCHYCPEANHTFTEIAQQHGLLSVVMAWCRERFPD